MDYEKKYKDALDWMRRMYPILNNSAKEDAEHYFPELRESEDERIRRVLLSFLGDIADKLFALHGISKNDALAYLEKQKEQTGKKWIYEDDYKAQLDAEYQQGLEDGRKEQKPAEWSEEDELMRSACIAFIQDEKFKGYERSYECIDWLKSLRPRPHWKPSKEQMDALKNARYMMSQSGDYYDTTAIIDSLISDLQKLL